MCGLLLISMSFNWSYAATTALGIFGSGPSLTDWIDGAIARSWNLRSPISENFLDPAGR